MKIQNSVSFYLRQLSEMEGTGRVKRSESLVLSLYDATSSKTYADSNLISELLENLGYSRRIYFSKASPACKDSYAEKQFNDLKILY